MNKIKKSVTDIALEDLNDAPDYTGNKNKIVSVKNDESGMEFINSFSEWATSISYNSGVVIKRNFGIYLCKTNHTSGTFVDDWITNDYWTPLTDYPGCVKIHSIGSCIPNAYMEQTGAAISRATYLDLFDLYNLVGLPHGSGDDEFTFNIPDTASEGDVIRHYKSGVSAAIGTHQGDANLSHSHGYGTLAAVGVGNHVHSQTKAGQYEGHGASGTACWYATGYQNTGGGGAHGHTMSGSVSNDGATESRPVNQAMIFIVKVL